jgi:hypothetical protein
MDNEWIQGLRHHPINWWFTLMMIHEGRGGQMASTDGRLREYNYTRSFHPVHLEQWIRVFQVDLEVNLFDPAEFDDNVCPFIGYRYIWHQNVLHRIESHHECHSFFRPIGDELPHHFMFQAIPKIAGDEYYFIHLYGRPQDLDYVWDAIFALLRLEYNPAYMESIGLERFSANSRREEPERRPWNLNVDRMRIWLSTRRGPEHLIHLSYFHFDRQGTLELFRGAILGSVFRFTGCLFSGGTVFEDGHFAFPPAFLLTVIVALRNQPVLLYAIIRTNATSLIGNDNVVI